jgi:hypothetical protein
MTEENYTRQLLQATYSRAINRPTCKEDIGLCNSPSSTAENLTSSKCLFYFQPFTDYFQLTEQNKKKFPESAWKATYYLFIWSCSFALLIWPGKYDSFYKPLHVFDGKFKAFNLVSSSICCNLGLLYTHFCCEQELELEICLVLVKAELIRPNC